MLETLLNVLNREEAKLWVENQKSKGLKVGFTNGCFDILHAGHIYYLNQAKDLVDVLVLGLNSDRSVSALKGPTRPVNKQDARATVMASLRMIDAVVIFDEDTPVELLKELEPDLHIKGGDYVKEELPEYPVVKGFGGDVEILSFLDGYSTTGILSGSSE